MKTGVKDKELVQKGKVTVGALCALYVLANVCAKAYYNALDATVIITCVVWGLLIFLIPRGAAGFLLAGTAIAVCSLLFPGGSGAFSLVNLAMWVLSAAIALILLRSPSVRAYAERKRKATKLIGITGPTGAGKTTALRTLEDLSVAVIDADAVYHELLEENERLRDAVTKRFGDLLLDETGKLDRKKLGERVFGDPEALEALNQITHKFVGEEIERRVEYARTQGKSSAVDAIALIESGLGEKCDVTVAVLAPAEVRVRRIMEREGISEEYARKRVAAQKEDDFFRANCTYVLENTAEDTPDTFSPRARALFEQILNP